MASLREFQLFFRDALAIVNMILVLSEMLFGENFDALVTSFGLSQKGLK